MADSLRIGIAGLGTVGSSLVRILQQRSKELAITCGRAIEIIAVSARDRSRDRGLDLAGITWFDTPEEMAKKPKSMFWWSWSVVPRVLPKGRARRLVSWHPCGDSQQGAAGETRCRACHYGGRKGALLNFRAAVAGGIPIIKALRESLTGNHVSRIYGIMNGTCNYILTKMEKEGLSFEACLKEAQRLGYAEADPAFDIEGNDTAHKLAILTTLAFGSKIAADDIYLEGISNISIEDIQAAADLGYRIKLLGVAHVTESGIEQRVHPTMVPLDSVIAQVDGVTNAVAVESDILGELLMVGPGAGGNATASAVLGDIADIAKSRPGVQQVPVLGRPAKSLTEYRRAKMKSHEGGYFIRLTVKDKAGVFASIATRMAENNISLESIVQHSRVHTEGGPQTIILVTHATMEDAIRKAVKAIKSEKYLVNEPQVIRIERT